MVNYTVVVNREAETDLRRIYDYLKTTASEETADHVQSGILNAIASLSTFPHRHTSISAISNEQATYRRILKWSYKIVFTIEEDSFQVVVVDINHTKQDPEILIAKFKK